MTAVSCKNPECLEGFGVDSASAVEQAWPPVIGSDEAMDEVLAVVGSANGSLRCARTGKPHWRTWLVMAAAGTALSLATIPAWAVDEATKAAALLHYNTARAAFEQKQYPEAAKEFQLAFEQLPLPVAGLWAGRCHALAGDLATAKTTYLKVIQLSPNELWFGDKQQQAQSAASRELERLKPMVSSEPRRSVGRSEPIDKSPIPEPVAPVADPWRTAGWVSLSAGAAGLALGTVTGLMLAGRHSELQSNCPNGICDPHAVNQGEVDGHNELRVASSVGFVAGGVLGALGVVLVLGSPASEAKSGLTLQLAPTGALLQGAF